MYYSPCDTPLPYRIGDIDTRFQISHEDLQNDIDEAGTIWSRERNTPLFVYDPKAELNINLVYDSRQFLTSQINQMEGNLNTGKGTIESRIQEYEQLSAQFKQKVADLNSEIESWNTKGGAPPDVYSKLIQEQSDLKAQAEQLNTLAKSVNRSADNYNAQVGQLNQTIQTFNTELHQKPEEGLYNGKDKRIEIYFNVNRNELIHTLAHEMGHAIGMEHVADPESIMYAFTSRQVTVSADDINELTYVCRKRSIFELIREKLPLLLEKISKK